MVCISTHLVISVRTWCISVCISSWCVILHIMYSKTVQPQSHQKTRALFLLFTTIGVLLQYNTAPSNYAYCTDTHHVFQSWCVSVRILSYQYAHGAYQYGPTRRQGLHLGKQVVQRVQETVTRAMVTEGEQESTSDGIDKGGQWLARERR